MLAPQTAVPQAPRELTSLLLHGPDAAGMSSTTLKLAPSLVP